MSKLDQIYHHLDLIIGTPFISLKSFLISIIFDQLYVLNLCPNCVGSFENLSGCWENKTENAIQSQDDE